MGLHSIVTVIAVAALSQRRKSPVRTPALQRPLSLHHVILNDRHPAEPGSVCSPAPISLKSAIQLGIYCRESRQIRC